MSNKKENKIEKCPLYDECPIRLHPLSATDKPNIAAHLGFRAFYTLLAWFVLGYNVNEGFFLAMCFFVLPVFMDCLKFSPRDEVRKIIRKIEITITMTLFFVSLLGVVGIYKLKSLNESWEIVTENFIGVLPSGFDIGVTWL